MHLATRPSRISIDMTPMIDIVFQLLIFFILTLQITTAEGDFDIRMPRSSQVAAHVALELPPLKLHLTAGQGGELKAIHLNGQSLTDIDHLHRRIVSIVGSDGQLAADVEVEIASDYNLAYKHVIAAITAVSGSVNPNGTIVKMVEKIKFSSPRPEMDG